MNLMPNERYRANSPTVISETLDGEAVIMDLRSGTYFSTRGTGAIIWTWFEGGATVRQIMTELSKTRGGDSALVGGAVDAFIRELADFHLIVADPNEADDAELPPAPGDLIYAPPVLAAYTDMDDLLQLDPVHDVDAESGWPVPRPRPDETSSTP
jgi:hypothetical protein